jgi:hypothetical protein
MPLIATKGNAGAFAYGFTAGGAPEVLGGMVLITPTSVDKTGTGSSATIGTNGSVEFSSCATLSLNGVFNTDYDNYMISIRHVLSTSAVALEVRLRASGTNAAGSNYTQQYVAADGTSVTGVRYTSVTEGRLGNASSGYSGDIMYLYGPFLTQPTACRNTSATGQFSGMIVDYAWTHSLSTSYDGISFIPTSNTLSGLVSVYGLVGT